MKLYIDQERGIVEAVVREGDGDTDYIHFCEVFKRKPEEQNGKIAILKYPDLEWELIDEEPITEVDEAEAWNILFEEG